MSSWATMVALLGTLMMRNMPDSSEHPNTTYTSHSFSIGNTR